MKGNCDETVAPVEVTESTDVQTYEDCNIIDWTAKITQVVCLGSMPWQADGKVSNDTVRSRWKVTMALAQLLRLRRRRFGWTGHVLRCNDSVHDVLFSQADYRVCGQYWTLVADLVGDVSLVCNFASEDSSLPLNRDEFNSSSSSFIRQAGDLGCFKCPVSCAKPYISASWYQKHLSKCPQPSMAITGWSEVK